MRKTIIIGSAASSSLVHAMLAGALSPPPIMVVDHIEAPALTDESLASMAKQHEEARKINWAALTCTSTDVGDYGQREVFRKKDNRPFYARFQKTKSRRR